MGQQLTTCCGPCNADSAKQFQSINGDMDDMKNAPILSGTSELDAEVSCIIAHGDSKNQVEEHMDSVLS